MIQKPLKKTIKVVTGQEAGSLFIERSQDPKFGDLSSSFALKSGADDPFVLAQKIVDALPKIEGVERVEALQPGFINFHLSPVMWVKLLNKILSEKEYGRSNMNKDQSIIVEFGQPNTHKLPHIGHFRSYSIGESISRVLEFSNADVVRANYQGDVGLQVAKCLWGYQELKLEESENLIENIEKLQDAYVHGSQNYEENKKEIDNLNRQIYENRGELWQKTRQWSLGYYERMNQRLNVEYDKQYFESETAKKGKEVVENNMGSVFEKSQGAIIFPGEKYDLHTRVFITSNGNPLYEAKDLGLIFLKENDFDFDRSLVSTAVEQEEYFKVVYKAAELIAPELAKKFTHIPFGMVSLKGKKMGSRKGNIISIDQLLSEVQNSLISLMKEKEYSEDEIEKAKEVLTIGAAKYAFLKTSVRNHMVFDIEKSISFDGDSGPYIQYTYARAKSILKESQTPTNIENQNLKKKELLLIKDISLFPEKIERATQKLDPSIICHYLFGLAQSFNSFYEVCPVLKAKDEDVKHLRLALVKVTSDILKKGLSLLGIEVLETI